MKIIGVTGGIGSGKTTLINYIKSKGFVVYLADEAGKEVMNQPEIISKINRIFDNEVLLPNGLLNRSKIAKLVFSNKELLNKLNEVVHPAVSIHFQNFLKEHQFEVLVFKEAAILFESGSYKTCDATILITAPEETRISRVVKRDGMSREEVIKRMANQMDESEKAKLATYIVENVDINLACENIDKIIDQLLKN